MGVAYSLILLGDNAAADAAVDTLLSDYAADPALSRAVREVANCYMASQRGEQALALYGKALGLNLSPEEQNDAYAGIARTDGIQANDAAVQSAIDFILEKFTDPNDAARAMFTIGEAYYYKAHTDPNTCNELSVYANDALPKAIAVWEQLIDYMPQSEFAPDAWYFSGASYRRLGEIEQMISCYITLTDNWPDYKFNWSADPYIGLGFEILKEQGYFTAEEADPWIESYYLKTIDKYPYGCMANEARTGLAKLYKSREIENSAVESKP